MELGRKLTESEIVHHKNEDKQDNDLDNLEVMPRSEHSRMHNLGKVLSDETKKKISKSKSGIPNVKDRKLTDEQVQFIRSVFISGDREFGCRALARMFKVSHTTIQDIVSQKHYINS